MLATIAALGLSAGFAATAEAVTVTNIDVPSTDSQPLGITPGPDGNLWFADPGAQAIGRLTPAGGVLLFNPLPGSGPAGITTGPDGSLWYATFDGKVQKISTGGVPTNVATLPGPASNLQGIVTGPDGNLWVAEKGGDLLWRVTPAGVSTSFGPAFSAQSVVRGPAGDPRVFVTTSAGVLSTSSSAPTAPTLFANTPGPAYGMVLGPDGKFWVTYTGGVAHIDTDGSSLPGGVAIPGVDARGIAAGADGALYFAQTALDKVGRLTTSGQFTDIPTPGCDGPDGVTAVGNEVYVTCFGSNAPLVRGRTIVKITLDTPPTPGGGGGGGGTPGGGNPAPNPAPPVLTPKASLSFAKAKAVAGKRFTVSTTFTSALTKSRVRVQFRSVNTRSKGAVKTFTTLASKVVTGRKASLSVKIAKPGAYFLRVTFVGPTGTTVNGKSVRVSVKPKAKAR
ncbi:MAG: hypothetical protein AB7U07_12715 [Thermoleophilia bacterium]